MSEYIVNVWKPDPDQEFREIITLGNFEKGYKHYMNVKVTAKNKEQAIEQALKAAYKELSEGDKLNISKADLMVNKVRLFSEYNGV